MRVIMRQALGTLAGLTVVTGAAYPLLITATAQALFPRQASGSLVWRGGVVVGSDLLGQQFDSRRYFWGRPSATSPTPYNGLASGGSNLGPTNPKLAAAARERVAVLLAADPNTATPVPADLVTTSGSGLDPHITPESAALQVSRVACARGMERAAVSRCVLACTERPQFGFLGRPRVNVLRLNLLLDRLESGNA